MQKQQDDLYEQWQGQRKGRGQQAPEGVFGSLHDLGLHALRKPGGADDAPGGRWHHEGLQRLSAKLLLLQCSPVVDTASFA